MLPTQAIHPEQMYLKLTNLQLDNKDFYIENTRFRQQKNVLLDLIDQYIRQIDRNNKQLEDAEILSVKREHLLKQIKMLEMDRLSIEQQLAQQSQRAKFSQKQQRQIALIENELDKVHALNSQLRVRIDELVNYVNKMGVLNKQLEHERILVDNYENQRQYYDNNWRHRMDNIKNQHGDYMRNLRFRQRQRNKLDQINLAEEQYKNRPVNRQLSQSKFVNSQYKMPPAIPQSRMKRPVH